MNPSPDSRRGFTAASSHGTEASLAETFQCAWENERARYDDGDITPSWPGVCHNALEAVISRVQDDALAQQLTPVEAVWIEQTVKAVQAISSTTFAFIPKPQIDPPKKKRITISKKNSSPTQSPPTLKEVEIVRDGVGKALEQIDRALARARETAARTPAPPPLVAPWSREKRLMITFRDVLKLQHMDDAELIRAELRVVQDFLAGQGIDTKDFDPGDPAVNTFFDCEDGALNLRDRPERFEMSAPALVDTETNEVLARGVVRLRETSITPLETSTTSLEEEDHAARPH